MNHGEVIERFGRNQINRRTGECTWRGHNVFCYDDKLFSYGHHHILAMRLDDGTFLKNGDFYSSSTSGHLSHVQQVIEGPTISFATLNAGPQGVKGVDQIVGKDVLDVQADMNEEVFRIPNQGYVKTRSNWASKPPGIPWSEFETEYWTEPWTPPGVGMFIEGLWGVSEEDKEQYQLPHDVVGGRWHILGAVLLGLTDVNTSKKRRFLCTTDERRYCVIECPGAPNTVPDAFASLLPEDLPSDEYERQGEWFFCDTGMTDANLAEMQGTSVSRINATAQRYPLFVPDDERGDGGNSHVVLQYETPKHTYARGKVYHRNRWGEISREHRTLNLNTWHTVHRAREVNSWSLDGRRVRFD